MKQFKKKSTGEVKARELTLRGFLVLNDGDVSEFNDRALDSAGYVVQTATSLRWIPKRDFETEYEEKN